jgi:Holliday junction DNA helicase RuvB
MDFSDIFGINQLLEWGKEAIGIKKSQYTPIEITPAKYIYRPKNLLEYIGQERAKDLVNLNLQKIRTIKPIHFLISGNKGCGKSTLAGIIGKELNFPITYHIGGAFTMEALIKFLSKNQDSNDPQILFIDEIHNLEKTLGEYLYPIIEDFILPEGNNLKLKPFIFIGATTEKNALIKKFAPLIDRCQADIILEPYRPEDIKAILKQYNDKIYQANIFEEVYDLLSKNTRLTPRIALAFFDDYMVCQDTQKVLSAHRIIKDGLTTSDIQILQHLKEVGKPIGIETLAMIVGITKVDFNYVIEPYLINQGYLSRTARGRIITQKGERLLQELK